MKSKSLRRVFNAISASDNNIQHVAFLLLYHSADRPERQSILNTLGDGTYGKVTNYAMEINPTKLLRTAHLKSKRKHQQKTRMQ
jgi:hypothetical protein